MKEDIFFLPFFIKEKIYVIDKEEVDFSVGAEVIFTPTEKLQDTTQSNLPYLVLHQDETPLLVEQDELLQNILKAISISPSQVEKLPLDSFQQIHIQNRKFIFVLSSAPLPKFFNQLEKNKTRLLTETTQALWSDSLSVLIANKQEKLALWNELKKAFGIK